MNAQQEERIRNDLIQLYREQIPTYVKQCTHVLEAENESVMEAYNYLHVACAKLEQENDKLKLDQLKLDQLITDRPGSKKNRLSEIVNDFAQVQQEFKTAFENSPEPAQLKSQISSPVLPINLQLQNDNKVREDSMTLSRREVENENAMLTAQLEQVINEKEYDEQVFFQQLNEAHSKIQQLEVENSTMLRNATDKQVGTLQTLIKFKEEQIQNLIAENEQLKKNSAHELEEIEFRRELQAIEEETTQAHRNMAAQAEELENTLAKTREELQKCQKHCEKTDEEKSRLQAENSRLQQENKTHLVDNTGHTKQLQEQDAEISRLQAEELQLKFDLRDKEKIIESLRHDYSELDKNYEFMTLKLQSEMQEKVAYKTTCEAERGESSDIMDSIRQQIRDMDNVTSEKFNEKNKEIEGLREALSLLLNWKDEHNNLVLNFGNGNNMQAFRRKYEQVWESILKPIKNGGEPIFTDANN